MFQIDQSLDNRREQIDCEDDFLKINVPALQWRIGAPKRESKAPHWRTSHNNWRNGSGLFGAPWSGHSKSDQWIIGRVSPVYIKQTFLFFSWISTQFFLLKDLLIQIFAVYKIPPVFPIQMLLLNQQHHITIHYHFHNLDNKANIYSKSHISNDFLKEKKHLFTYTSFFN